MIQLLCVIVTGCFSGTGYGGVFGAHGTKRLLLVRGNANSSDKGFMDQLLAMLRNETSRINANWKKNRAVNKTEDETSQLAHKACRHARRQRRLGTLLMRVEKAPTVQGMNMPVCISSLTCQCAYHH